MRWSISQTRTYTYTYNKRRLLASEGMSPDALQSWSMAYGYNALAQKISETGPAGVVVSNTVNALGQTTQITASTDGGAAKVLASTASYYPNGALKQFTYGNGIVHTMTQNARQLPSQSVDGNVLNLSTSFDANGNVSAITDNTASARQTRSMAYDGLDRLTSTSSPMFGTASYAYDTLDNLKQVSLSSGTAARNHYYCYNAANQLEFVRSGANCTSSPSVINLSYDVQGNVANKTGPAGGSYSFDYGNRLRSTAGQSYRYDADGRRVRSDTNNAQLQYSQYAKDGRLVWQRDEVTGKRINNVYLAGSLLAEITRPIGSTAVTVAYLHTDALGSPIAKTNATQGVIETSEYEPYGKLLNRVNDNRAGFTGHVMEAASGLIQMQQRWMDPGIGRFLSVDPVTAYSNPVGAFNRYKYANNNPYKFNDPDGRLPDWVFGVHTYTDSDRSKNSGHAWVSMREVGSNSTTTYGAWADGHQPAGGNGQAIPDNGAKSDVRMNMEAKSGYQKATQSAFFIISDKQKASFDSFVGKNFQYDALSNNCADFASGAVAATTGITLAAGSWDTLGVATPSGLSLKVDALHSFIDTKATSTTPAAISEKEQQEMKRQQGGE